MKKIVLLSAICLLGITQLYAQPCTPNPMYADSSGGVWPLQLPQLDPNSPAGYNLVIDIKTITDTCVTSPLALCLYIQAMRVASIDGLPSGFTFAEAYNGNVGGFNSWVNGGTAPNWVSIQGCIVISAPQSAVQAAYNASGPDLGITLNLDLYAKNFDPNSPILANYTWTSTIGVVAPYDFNGGGNPTFPTSCASLNYQGNQTSFAGLLPSAGTFDLNVTAPANCNWALNGWDTWFTYSPEFGTGDGTITFTYDANTTGAGRYAMLDFDGQLYTISQMADTCAMNITYDTTIFDPFGGFMVFDIIFNDPNCYWNLVTRSICEGVTVDPMYGTGSTTVTVTVAPNPDNTPRQCELDFGNGHVVTLNQQAGTVGIQEDNAGIFNLYPNPANDMVTITIPNSSGKEVLSIYTVAGQLLSQTQLTATQQQVSTTNLANGIYVFTLVDTQGNNSHKKVVINR